MNERDVCPSCHLQRLLCPFLGRLPGKVSAEASSSGIQYVFLLLMFKRILHLYYTGSTAGWPQKHHFVSYVMVIDHISQSSFNPTDICFRVPNLLYSSCNTCANVMQLKVVSCSFIYQSPVIRLEKHHWIPAPLSLSLFPATWHVDCAFIRRNKSMGETRARDRGPQK